MKSTVRKKVLSSKVSVPGRGSMEVEAKSSDDELFQSVFGTDAEQAKVLARIRHDVAAGLLEGKLVGGEVRLRR